MALGFLRGLHVRAFVCVGVLCACMGLGPFSLDPPPLTFVCLSSVGCEVGDEVLGSQVLGFLFWFGSEGWVKEKGCL